MGPAAAQRLVFSGSVNRETCKNDQIYKNFATISAMKRRDLITLVSLEMFNEMGESNLAAIDIANELDISPGNLYYHFKGKEQIIAELFANLSVQVNELFNLEIRDEDALTDSWLRLYVLLELIYDYRFLFRGVSDINTRYPETGKKLIRLIERLRKSYYNWIHRTSELRILEIPPDQKSIMERIANNLALVMLYWESFQVVLGHPENKREYVEEASLQTLAHLSPFLKPEDIAKIEMCHQSYFGDSALSEE